MRLGRWLRLIGMDVAGPGNLDDEELMLKARREMRVLITRDRKLHKKCQACGAGSMLIESNRLTDQLREMAGEGITLELDPQRCTICNSPLIEPGQRSNDDYQTRQCEGCGKIYWQGSHWKRMEEILENARREKGQQPRKP